VQTQTQIHFGHLAEQFTINSPLGALVPRLQALFVARGADTAAAFHAAVLLIARFIQREAFVLAIRDALWVTIGVTILAIIAVLFVRPSRKPQPIPEQASGAQVVTESSAAVPAEAMLAG
jgi:hypothetical protein